MVTVWLYCNGKTFWRGQHNGGASVSDLLLRLVCSFILQDLFEDLFKCGIKKQGRPKAVRIGNLSFEADKPCLDWRFECDVFLVRLNRRGLEDACIRLLAYGGDRDDAG